MKVHFSRKALVFAVASLMIAAAGHSMAQQNAFRVIMFNAEPFGGPTTAGGGYCLDLMTAIAERAGFTLEIVEPLGTVQGLLQAAVDQQTDIVCSAASPLKERRDMGLAFTSSIFTNAEALVVLATDTTPYTAVTDFSGRLIGITAGSNAQINYLTSTGVQFREYASAAERDQALRSGEIAAMVLSAVGFNYQQRLGNYADMRAVETYVPHVVTHSGIVVRNTDVLLLGMIQAALESLKADGTVNALADQWGMPRPVY